MAAPTPAPLSSPRRWIHHPTFIISLIVWLLGVTWGVMQTVLCLRQTTGMPGAFAVAVWIIMMLMLFAAAFQQFMVFECIHKFEQNRPVWESKYPKWYGTDFECYVRLMVVLLLLLAGGEIPLQFKEFTEWRLGQHWDVPRYIFAISSTALYASLLVWDLFAAYRRDHNFKSFTPTKLFPHEWELDQQFFWSDLLGVFFWAILSLVTALPDPPASQQPTAPEGLVQNLRDLAVVIALLIAVVYISLIGFRLRRWKDLLPWA
jgi:hypothetical protein